VDIYLDTVLWNELLQQRVAPASLVAVLERRSARIVLSDEAIYELARTFGSQRANGREKAKELFEYLSGYIDVSIPIVKDFMTLVAAEMNALQLQMREIYPFINASDYEIVKALVARLSEGSLSPEAQARIDERAALRARDRIGISSFLNENSDIREALRGISERHLPDWLDREANSVASLNYLADQIHSYFFEHPRHEVMEYVLALRGAVANRVARAVIRRNLYLNWRGAHRPSVAKDIFPDSTHIVSSNYCDVYATKEGGQLGYARLLLTPSTVVCIYDGQSPVDEWLVSLT
jgi:hypothetical protein